MNGVICNAVVAVCVLGINPATLAGDAHLTFDEIMKIERPTFVDISADGKKLLYAATSPARNPRDADAMTSALALAYYAIDLRTGKRWQLDLSTSQGQHMPVGRTEDAKPRWHPDGKRILYISSASGTSELWICNERGGGRQQLSGRALAGTRMQGTYVVGFAVDPAGIRVALAREPIGSVWAPSTNGERVRKGSDPSGRRVISISSDLEFFGRLTRESHQGASGITVVDMEGTREEEVTSGLRAVRNLGFSPDGHKLLFLPTLAVWQGKATANLDPLYIDLRTRAVSNAFNDPNHIENRGDWCSGGTELCFVVEKNLTGNAWGSHGLSLWVVSTDGLRKRTIGDFEGVGNNGPPPFWSRYDRRVYALVRERGSDRLFAFTSSAGTSRDPITPEDMHVADVSFASDGRTVAVVMGNRNTPDEVYIGDIRNRVFRKVTEFSSQLRRKDLGTITRVRWKSGDDRFDVEGFLLTPPSYVEGQRYPTLLAIQGGPGPWPNDFYTLRLKTYSNGPVQLLAQAGYAVLMPSRRGDTGYGLEYHQALIGNIGEGDVRHDVLTGIEHLVERGIADPERLGIFGKSYGGFSTFWAAGETTRFKAAISDDGVLNWILTRHYENPSYESGWVEFYMGGQVHEASGNWWKATPMRHADRIVTPILARISYADASVGQLDSRLQMATHRRLYDMMAERGVPMEILVYPGEGHAITDVINAKDYFERTLSWFNYWLLDKPFPDPDLQKQFDAYKARMRSAGLWR